jgi:hypothetical protein
MEKRNKKIGLAIMCAGPLAAAFFFWYFKLDGRIVDFTNPSLVLKAMLTTLCLIVGLYFGLYFAAGKKVALQLGGGLAVLMVLAYVINFLFYR